jgi:heparanase 1
MMFSRRLGTAVVVLAGIGLAIYGNAASARQATARIAITPAGMARIGTVDLRFQTYNVEMLEVTGGKFWKPYGPELDAILKGDKSASPPSSTGDTPAGMDPRLYEYRPPIDLGNARLRKLASALGPAYVRVSGTWANSTYFQESDEAPSTPPPGFMGFLKRRQWNGVVDFAKAVNAEIVTSFPTSVGTRDQSGVWTATEARRWVEYTKSIGGSWAAAEFMNEPNLAVIGGAPKGYDAAAYGRDFKAFRAFADAVVPDMLVLGPGSVVETTGEWGMTQRRVQAQPARPALTILSTRDLLTASRPASVDAFSYHHYGATSMRCGATGMSTAADDALSEGWLRRTDETLAFYKPLRNEFAPGAPLWLTETADAACGGNPWGNTFLDTFRYLDQMGRLAKQDVKVVMHNTLAASDYGLLDEHAGFAPKPNYWGALLWRRLMGSTVLESGVPIQPGLHVYAHCLRDNPGGVALLVLNTDQTASRMLSVPAGERYTLASPPDANLQTRRVRLNGTELALGATNDLPKVSGQRIAEGQVTFAATTITFLAFPDAGNATCR